jgi:chitodextrinase
MSAKPARVALSWSASTDNMGVAGYRVYRNGAMVGTATATGYSDSPGGKKGSSYTYTVVDYDAAGNVSPQSNAVTLRS